RRARALGGKGAARRRRLHVPSGERAALPRPVRSRGRFRTCGLRRRRVEAPGRRDRRPARGNEAMNALATIRQAPGLDRYLDLLEHRLESAVAVFPGRLGDVGTDTLAAGGKRLRPLLVFLFAPPRQRGGERGGARGARGQRG